MKSLLFPFLLISLLNTSPNVDFGSEKGGMNWRIINDDVMGGLSRSSVRFNDNSILFQGKVSLENNGGFASLKSNFQTFDLSAYENVKIRLRGKGQIFALTLETSQVWYHPYFKMNIPLSSEDWEVVTLPLAEFKQYVIGRTTGKSLDRKSQQDILRIGLTTNEKKASAFEVEIDYIRFE